MSVQVVGDRAVKVVEVSETSVVLDVSGVGPQGPAGGGAGGSYTHIQSIPNAIWLVNHTLSFYPNVTVVDSAGTVVEGQIEYLSATQIRLTFNAAFAGNAYLS